jgi:ribose transport system substrate-binding protein
LAVDYAVALATGGQKPSTTTFPNTVFEDSTTGHPHPVECRKNLSPDIYLSAQLSPAVQSALVK